MSKSIAEIYQCRQCGYCCQGETTVSLDANDQQRLSTHLGLPLEEVKRRYLRVTGNTVQMRIVDGHCIFYDHGCTVHAGKPWRCSQWPLHPSMLDDAGNFAVITGSCPGFQEGLTHAQFRRAMRKA